MSKVKKPRFDSLGYPGNHRAKRELGELIETFGEFGALYKFPREEPYLAVVFEIGKGFPGNPVKRMVSVRTLTLSVLQDVIQDAIRFHESKWLQDRQLEIVLDYLYAELNRRLNKDAEQASKAFQDSLPLKPGQGYAALAAAEKELKK